MTNVALVIPTYVAELVTLPLRRLGLDPFLGDDLVTCPLPYEDGTELAIAVLCVAQRGWFREKAKVAVSLVKLDENTRAVSVYLRKVIPYPKGPHDMSFFMNISALVRAMAWACRNRRDGRVLGPTQTARVAAEKTYSGLLGCGLITNS